MRYIVKNKSGAEFQVTEDDYRYLKGKDGYECRIDDGTIEPQKLDKYPVKDENSSWYTLSNGKRIQGEANANREQRKINE